MKLYMTYIFPKSSPTATLLPSLDRANETSLAYLLITFNCRFCKFWHTKFLPRMYTNFSPLYTAILVTKSGIESIYGIFNFDYLVTKS